MGIFSSRRRRIYYIKKAYQKLFMVRHVKMFIIGSVITNIVIYFYEKQRLEEAIYRAHISVKSTSDILMTPLIFINAFVVVGAILWATFITLKSNNRLGKNLAHLSAALRKLSEGNLGANICGVECKLLGDFFLIFNRAMDLLQAKKSAVKDSVSAMEKHLSDHGDKKEALSLLYRETENIEKTLSDLRLRS